MTIVSDSFYSSSEYANYLTYRTLKKTINRQLTHKQTIQNKDIESLINSNPELYEAHELAGDAYIAMGKKQLAKAAFSTALTKQLVWFRGQAPHRRKTSNDK